MRSHSGGDSVASGTVSLLMRSHSGGDSVASGIVSLLFLTQESFWWRQCSVRYSLPLILNAGVILMETVSVASGIVSLLMSHCGGDSVASGIVSLLFLTQESFWWRQCQ